VKKLRVLQIICRTYSPETQGGGQEAIHQPCQATHSLDVDNTIFALASQPELAVMNVSEGRLVPSPIARTDSLLNRPQRS